MRFPIIDSIKAGKEQVTQFLGYEHLPVVHDGAFYDTKNITTENFPILTPRNERTLVKTFTNFQGMVDKDGLVYVDDGKVYVEGTEVSGLTLYDEGMKQIVKMGAYLVFFPDKVWLNTADGTHGSLDAETEVTGSIAFTLCGADGSAITYHEASYYTNHTPANGDYKMETINGKTSLSVYSSVTGLWVPVPTTYMKIAGTGIGADISEGDGVKISVDFTNVTWDAGKNVFINDEGSNIRSNTFATKTVSADYIIVPALLNENKTFSTTITVERKSPDMSFVVECQNRLWGCSDDGHEIYCCKLGDVKNWNVFAGISTDSWAATIGSDGVFTGAIAYLGYPIFFKEDSSIRVSISAIGAHSTKETKLRGVEAGSEGSLVQLNEVLFYKAKCGVMMYDGNFPTEVSKSLGGVRYHSAVSGSINNRYYINMADANNERTTFVYDASTGLWAREEVIDISQFLTLHDEIFFASGQDVFSVNGVEIGDAEGNFTWYAESGKIGFETDNKKYVSKINIRLQVEAGSNVDFWLNYDSSDIWEHQWQISGTGLRTVSIPVRPHRCDHFSFRISGYGKAKIFKISRTYSEGSDT